MDRRRTRRTARGRSPHDPPRRRQAALARLPGRVGARASPAATGSAPAASCRRCCSTTPRRSRSRSACGPPRRARSPGSRRPRSARWPSSSRCCPSRLRRRVRALGDATSAFSFDGPQIDADLLAEVAGACRDGVAAALRLRRRATTAPRSARPSRRRSSTAATAGIWSRSTSIATTGARSAWTGSAAACGSAAAAAGARFPAAIPRPTSSANCSAQATSASGAAEPGRVRVTAPATRIQQRVPEPLRDRRARRRRTRASSRTRGAWHPGFLVWMATARRADRDPRPAGAARSSRDGDRACGWRGRPRAPADRDRQLAQAGRVDAAPQDGHWPARPDRAIGSPDIELRHTTSASPAWRRWAPTWPATSPTTTSPSSSTTAPRAG